MNIRAPYRFGGYSHIPQRALSSNVMSMRVLVVEDEKKTASLHPQGAAERGLRGGCAARRQ